MEAFKAFKVTLEKKTWLVESLKHMKQFGYLICGKITQI